ncbi:uncharacterized protein LOC103516813 [Trichonephila clavipes]|nr:uncharacterized protein LOC103516813 [Trichonephila clavipes]
MWTYTMTVLYWIKNKENWRTFVKNRVKEINQLSTARVWRHVPGQSNPVDLPSRGCTLKILSDLRWWEGPQYFVFLQKTDQIPKYKLTKKKSQKRKGWK